MASRVCELEPPSLEPALLLGPGAAERLVGIRAEQLRAYARQPGGPAVVKLSSGQLMYRRAELLDWIERRTVPAPAKLLPEAIVDSS
jgi:hypothetical protein